MTIALCLLVALFVGDAAAARPQFFVFDNGVGRGSWTPEQQAKTVKELGYDGISYNYTNPEDLARWQKALGEQGLKLFGLYVYTWFDKSPQYDPRLPEAIKLLKGTDTVLWITIREAQVKGDHDAEAVDAGAADRRPRAGERRARRAVRPRRTSTSRTAPMPRASPRRPSGPTSGPASTCATSS